MFPLKNRQSISLGYKFGQPTSYSNFHLGTDYLVPNGTEVMAPFNGVVTTYIGTELGSTVFFKPDNLDVIIRMGHLQEFKASGRVLEGQTIALSDTSGTLSGGIPHVHVDISKHSLQLNNISNFIDPEKFNWEDSPNIAVDFQNIWHRPAAKGEIAYFQKRLLNGSILNEADLKVKMSYWYGIVYPGGKYSLLGDARWQFEKVK